MRVTFIPSREPISENEEQGRTDSFRPQPSFVEKALKAMTARWSGNQPTETSAQTVNQKVA